MTHPDTFAEVERRAFEARITMQDLCERARIAQSTWSRAKKAGRIRVNTLRKLEATLAELESAEA